MQATQDLQNSVTLIANKATMARVYLSVEGSTGPLYGVSGALVATPPGATPIPPLLHSTNSVALTAISDVSVPRGDLTRSLNFMLPPEWTAGRTLNLALSKLYIQGQEVALPCDGCGNLDEIGAPRYVHFQPTKPINIVLAPHIYAHGAAPLTPEMIFTPHGALKWMNNIYPLAGNFPEDRSGINIVTILPMNTTSTDLSFGGDGGGDFLDALEWELLSLQIANDNWPADTHLFAVTPCGCGGRARRPGRVGYADIWNRQAGMAPAPSGMGGYGNIWGHELAHNLGRKHASSSHGEETDGFWEELWEIVTEDDDVDWNFPYPHGGLGQPGLAINTRQWIPGGAPHLIMPGVGAYGEKHAHDMMSYGHVSSENTAMWISPYTYEALYEKFKIVASAAAAPPAAPTEKVAVAGKIFANGTAELRPSFRARTRFGTGDGAAGAYRIDLVGAQGRTLSTWRFDASRTEGVPYLTFSEVVPWKAGVEKIVVAGPTGVSPSAASARTRHWSKSHPRRATNRREGLNGMRPTPTATC